MGLKRYRYFLWISAVEVAAAAIYLSMIPGDPKNTIFLGMSLIRLVNFAVFLALGFGLAATGVWLHRIPRLGNFFMRLSSSAAAWQKTVWYLSLMLMGLALFPAYRIKDFELIWERLLPSVILTTGLLVTLLLVMIQEGVSKKYTAAGEFRFKKNELRTWLLFLVITGGGAAAVWSTGFGILSPNNRLWNTAGVPVLFEQVLYLVFGYVFLTGLKSIYFPTRKWKLAPWLICIVLWGAAVAAWYGQPVSKSWFVYQPDAPNYEYYPLSDAKRFDLGARFMLAGEGIFNGVTEEKPFQMAYLALLHGIAGYDYLDLMSIQVVIMGLIVPLLFLIGKEVYSTEFGLALAVMAILYEVNTFNASVAINSAHIKLMLTEPLTLFGVVLITYTLIRWLKDSSQVSWGVITLGLVAFFTYVRPNVLLLSLAAFGLIIWVAFPKIWLGIKNFILASTGFLGVLLPWMIYAYSKYGYLVLINKFKYIIRTRLFETFHFQEPVVGKIARLSLRSGGVVFLTGTAFWAGAKLQAAHFINNLVKSLLVFPTSLKLAKIYDVLDQPYWDERVIWDGTVGVLFFVNLAIILLGLVHLVNQKKAIGFAPFAVAVMYNLASSLALTSGGRYLKPSIWIFILYYLAGIYCLIDKIFLTVRFSPSSVEAVKQDNVPATRSRSKNRFQWIAAGALIGVGVLIPVSDALIPQKYPKSDPAELIQMLPDGAVESLGLGAEELVQLVGETNLQIFHGDAVYPQKVNDPTYFEFSIIGDRGSLRSRFDDPTGMISYFPGETEVIAVGCHKPGHDGAYKQMILISLQEEDLFYSNGIDWKDYCRIRFDQAGGSK